MKRIIVWTWMLAAATALAAQPAAAQLPVGVQISWHWSDDGWRSGPVVDGYVHWRDGAAYRTVHRDRAPSRVLPARRARLRVPPGHMPPPGMCRVWIVGVPPGHQPPPRRCTRALFAYQSPSMVILHTPLRDGRWWSPARDGWRGHDRWDRGDRWDDWDDRWDDDWDDDDWDDDWDDDDWDDDWDDDDRWKEGPRRGRGNAPGRGRGASRGRGSGF